MRPHSHETPSRHHPNPQRLARPQGNIISSDVPGHRTLCHDCLAAPHRKHHPFSQLWLGRSRFTLIFPSSLSRRQKQSGSYPPSLPSPAFDRPCLMCSDRPELPHWEARSTHPFPTGSWLSTHFQIQAHLPSLCLPSFIVNLVKDRVIGLFEWP